MANSPKTKKILIGKYVTAINEYGKWMSAVVEAITEFASVKLPRQSDSFHTHCIHFPK